VKQIRRRLSYANVMSTVSVFLILGGATAIAAKVPKRSVGPRQLKANAVRTSKIKANAVTTRKIKRKAVTTSKLRDSAVKNAKIADGAVTGAKVFDGTLTGADIDLSSLGTVPSAAEAESLAGRRSYSIKLAAGESAPIASHGAVTLTAACDQPGGNDRVRVIATTTAEETAVSGPFAEFVGPGSSEEERTLVSLVEPLGTVAVGSNDAWAMDPDGKLLSLPDTIVALNYAGATCVLAGVAEGIG